MMQKLSSLSLFPPCFRTCKNVRVANLLEISVQRKLSGEKAKKILGSPVFSRENWGVFEKKANIIRKSADLQFCIRCKKDFCPLLNNEVIITLFRWSKLYGFIN